MNDWPVFCPLRPWPPPATVKLALGERVSDVRASQRLTDSAACLVAGGRGPDRELERLLARHNRSPGAKPILELNMRHGLSPCEGRDDNTRRTETSETIRVARGLVSTRNGRDGRRHMIEEAAPFIEINDEHSARPRRAHARARSAAAAAGTSCTSAARRRSTSGSRAPRRRSPRPAQPGRNRSRSPPVR